MASACQRMQAAVSGMSRPTVSVIGLPASMRLDDPQLAPVGLDQVRPADAGPACDRPGSGATSARRRRLARGGDREVHVGRSALRDLRDRPAGRRVLGREPPAPCASRNSPSMNSCVLRSGGRSRPSSRRSAGIRVSVIAGAPGRCGGAASLAQTQASTRGVTRDGRGAADRPGSRRCHVYPIDPRLSWRPETGSEASRPEPVVGRAIRWPRCDPGSSVERGNRRRRRDRRAPGGRGDRRLVRPGGRLQRPALREEQAPVRVRAPARHRRRRQLRRTGRRSR